jgi:hypothetical protein
LGEFAKDKRIDTTKAGVVDRSNDVFKYENRVKCYNAITEFICKNLKAGEKS